MSKMESMQITIRQHTGQMSDLLGQLRTMEDDMKKIQIDRHNDPVERVNNK